MPFNPRLLKRHIQTAEVDINVQHLPKEGDPAPGGHRHGAVVSHHVLSGDVVVREQTLRILLLQSAPLPHRRQTSTTRQPPARSQSPVVLPEMPPVTLSELHKTLLIHPTHRLTEGGGNLSRPS